MESALVICGSNPAGDPRPNRMIRCLARDYAVTVLSRGRSNIAGVVEQAIPPYPDVPFSRKLLGVICRRLGRRRPAVWPPGLSQLASKLRRQRFSVITAHDLDLLPVALAIAGRHSRVLFDAREYYPRQGEDRWWWRTMFQPMARSLCRDYLRRATSIMTVSPGLAAEYQREFGVRCFLVPSLPPPVELSPTPVDPARIRMIHHGQAAPARRLDLMIDAMRLLPPQFTLDLMLVDLDSPYGRKLQQHAAGLPSVTFRQPVTLPQLVHETNRYDVGLYLLAPTSFNTLHALPNKFFEFIQARLMIAIGPSPDMADFVRRYNLGVVADAFTAEAIAAALRNVAPAEISRFKKNAHAAAQTLNSTRTDEIIRALVRGETPPPPP